MIYIYININCLNIKLFMSFSKICVLLHLLTNSQPSLLWLGETPWTSRPPANPQIHPVMNAIPEPLGMIWNDTVDGSEIRRSPVEVGSFFHYLQDFSTIPGGCLGFLPPCEQREPNPYDIPLIIRIGSFSGILILAYEPIPHISGDCTILYFQTNQPGAFEHCSIWNDYEYPKKTSKISRLKWLLMA